MSHGTTYSVLNCELQPKLTFRGPRIHRCESQKEGIYTVHLNHTVLCMLHLVRHFSLTVSYNAARIWWLLLL